MMSQPRAAAAIVSNCVATVPSIIRRLCSGVGRAADGFAFPVERSAGPIGVTGIPRLAIQSWKSGGTHRRISWPSALSASASATSGWTSPLDPIVDSSARITPPSGPCWLCASYARDREFRRAFQACDCGRVLRVCEWEECPPGPAPSEVLPAAPFRTTPASRWRNDRRRQAPLACYRVCYSGAKGLQSLAKRGEPRRFRSGSSATTIEVKRLTVRNRAVRAIHPDPRRSALCQALAQRSRRLSWLGTR